MRRAAVACIGAVAAVTAYWLSRPPEVARPATPVSRPVGARAQPSVSPAPSRVARDPFAFGGGRAEPLSERRIEEGEPQFETAPLVPTPTPSPLRLAGLVGRGGRLHAALIADGEVVLAAVGEPAFGWTVVEIDPVAGVLLRDAAGAPLRLPVAR